MEAELRLQQALEHIEAQDKFIKKMKGQLTDALVECARLYEENTELKQEEKAA